MGDLPRSGLAAGAEVAMAGWTWTPQANAWEGRLMHLVRITESEIVTVGPTGEATGCDMLLEMITHDGAPAGRLRICLENKNRQRAEEGVCRFNLLKSVLAVDQIDDTSQLHSVPFLVSVRGDLLPDPENAEAMRHQISGLYREADILTGLARLAGAPRTFRNNEDTRAMNADVVAELRRLRAVSVEETPALAA